MYTWDTLWLMVWKGKCGSWEYLEFVQETVDGAWTRVMWYRR